MKQLSASNFGHLKAHDEQLVRLGLLAERYFAEDPNTCLLKLRQLAEALTQLTASRVGLFSTPDEKQADLLRRLQDHGILPREVASLFHEVRKAGNDANHKLAGDHRTALLVLRLTWQLSLWFHRAFKDPGFKSGPFLPPSWPADQSAELQAELEALRGELNEYRAAHHQAAQALEATKAQAQQSEEERAFWETMAAEAEAAKHELNERLAALQAQATAQPAQAVTNLIAAATSAAAVLQISEADTRKLIDEQLTAAGWTANSATHTYAKGARPQKGKNLAIAEWPTGSGPADYVLFTGLMPVAVVEAKRKNVDVSGGLQQAKRYSRDFTASADVEMPAAQGNEFHIPFAFSTNGRPFLRQLATKSGVWFCDLRRADNLSQPLDGWYTPEGLAALLKRDEAKAHEKLDNEPFNYGFPLRPYQQAAIRAAESAIQTGQRELLLAMATGTGKTKTCIALIYRLLKAERFRRILFLVDRSALGEQAANAFKDTRMENLQTFADTFGIKELEDMAPDSDTSVHIATVQGMVQRVLYPSDDASPPNVDQYDCIVVDECHRGYLLDRELSDTELTFRGYEDYISKYRRVLDFFDAVKIGLTATPALHTTQIFGPPVFTYSYREAVIDGFLVDYEPPIQITTELSANGIQWKAGEEVKVYDVQRSQIDLFKAPDEIKLEVDTFNRKVITENFNRVVCEYLARELDPASRRKTLIFCVNDAHADLVVQLMKEAFAQQYGSVEDDAVIKITGAADKPLSLIRRYKNERLPNVAVTVDLLTTGIDVPEICNLVFLRRVNSRILFDQMLGRATRLCPGIDAGGEGGGDKESFRVFDAVQIFDALQGITAMQPVVVNPSVSFTQLAQELATVTDDDARALARDQFLAKLQRKKRHLGDDAARDFETRAGMPPEAFIRRLRAMTLQDVAAWFAQHPDLGEILDRKGNGPREPVFVSDHPDQLKDVARGYGAAKKPQDYLLEFSAFIKSHSNGISAKPDQEAGLPILRISAVRPMKLDLMDRRFLPPGFAGAQQYTLRTGDLLFTRYNGNRELVGACARVTQAPDLVVYPDKLIRVRVRGDVVEPSFVEKVVASADSRRFLFDRVKTSAGQVGIAGQDLKQLPVPLPPLQEQQRIADTLDAQLARVDACRGRLERVPVILKRFRQAVLHAATSGELTADWRAERGVAELWRSCVLADVADIQGGVTKDAKRQSERDEELPYLRVANVQRGWLDLTEVKTIRMPVEKAAALLLQPGDVLFNEGGDIDKVGRGWIWEGQIQRCVFQNHVFRARLHDPGTQPKFVSWWGNSVGLNYFLRAGKQTTNLASINKSVLSKLPLLLPPPDEQAEIVRRVDSLFALADAIEARWQAARAQVERLTPALLAKAFRGELVPQDPNDEPAAELLKRLAQSRADAPAKARKPRQRQPA